MGVTQTKLSVCRVLQIKLLVVRDVQVITRNTFPVGTDLLDRGHLAVVGAPKRLIVVLHGVILRLFRV